MMPVARWPLVVLALFIEFSILLPNLAKSEELDEQALSQFLKAPASFIESHVKERHAFYGLASYYSNIAIYVVDKGVLRELDNGDSTTLTGAQWLAIAGRLKVLVVSMPGLMVRLDGQELVFDNPQLVAEVGDGARLLDKSDLATLGPELVQITYAHLWRPLAWLSRRVESLLALIHAHGVTNWGLTIVVFALLLKLVLLPIGILTIRLQRENSRVQALLAPQLAIIKTKYDGEEAHKRMMAAYKQANVSPFYTLKPMLGTFIQIPILIAVFNALGEMPQFAGQSFLWIDDLAYPDSIGQLPVVIPWIGNEISLLPWLMTGATLLSSVFYENRLAPASELRRQKRNVCLMAVVFLILFYPFPAAMVLFWLLVNLLQTVQQKYIRI